MIFVFNNLKYDTDKMELISTKCQRIFMQTLCFLGTSTSHKHYASCVQLFKSAKGNWLLTYEKECGSQTYGEALTEREAKNLLLKYDLKAYEKLFGELEDA